VPQLGASSACCWLLDKGCGGARARGRLIDSCITQLKAQGPSGTCNESKAEGGKRVPRSSNSHGARPVRLIITMMQWIRTSRLSIKNSLSLGRGDRGARTSGRSHAATGYPWWRCMQDHHPHQATKHARVRGCRATPRSSNCWAISSRSILPSFFLSSRSNTCQGVDLPDLRFAPGLPPGWRRVAERCEGGWAVVVPVQPLAHLPTAPEPRSATVRGGVRECLAARGRRPNTRH